MRIDFRARKTEAQWQEAVDSFATKLAPRWFDLMQWTAVLGLIINRVVRARAQSSGPRSPTRSAARTKPRKGTLIGRVLHTHNEFAVVVKENPVAVKVLPLKTERTGGDMTQGTERLIAPSTEQLANVQSYQLIRLTRARTHDGELFFVGDKLFGGFWKTVTKRSAIRLPDV